MLKHGISFRPSSLWKNTEVSGIVCFGTPDALMIRSGLAFPSNACNAAIAPILSTSILDFLLSTTPVFEMIHSSLLSISFAVSLDVSI